MFCGQCGTNNPQNARFCRACGAALVSPDANGNSPESQVYPAETPVAAGLGAASGNAAQATSNEQINQSDQIPAYLSQENPSEETPTETVSAPNRKKSKGKLIAIIVAIAIVIIAAVIGALLYFNDQADKSLHLTHAVLIDIEAENYNENDTLIPVQVNGSDIDGNPVDGVRFVNAYGEGIELTKGDYQFSFPASPLTEDGILYNTPTQAIQVQLGEDLEAGQTVDIRTEVQVHFTRSTALDQTDEMIDNAYRYAVLVPDQTARAEELKEVTEQVHADAVKNEEIRKSEEALQNRINDLRSQGYQIFTGEVIKSTPYDRAVERGAGGFMPNFQEPYAPLYILKLDHPQNLTYVSTYKSAAGQLVDTTVDDMNFDSSEPWENYVGQTITIAVKSDQMLEMYHDASYIGDILVLEAILVSP